MKCVLSIVGNFVTVLFHLMRAENHIQTVGGQEIFGDILAESDADTTLTRSAARAFLRIGPQHLAEQAVILGLALAVGFADVVEGDAILGEQTAMHNEDLVVDHVAPVLFFYKLSRNNNFTNWEVK